MANLSTQNIGANYKGILNLGSTINTPLSTTLRAITDGDGNTTPLQLATNRIALGSGTISGTSLLNFPDAGTTAADGIQFGIGSSNLYRSGLNTIRTDGELISTSFKSVFGVFASNTMYVSNSAGLFLGYGGGGGGLNLLPNQGTTVMAKLNATGQFDLTPPTLTGSSATSALSISQTWNTTGNPSLIFANVTNTASGASANLIDLQIGGASMFSVDKNGVIRSGNSIRVPQASDFQWYNRSRIFSDANGNIRFTNSAITDFGMLQFGGTTSSFPAFKRSSANLQARLADDTGFTFIEDLYRRAGSGSPEGVVTAPVGAIYHRTDGSAGTSFYVKESGSGNTGWIAK
jgi:uncharacterized lipoprotein NlpE involved in copper resistance